MNPKARVALAARASVGAVCLLRVRVRFGSCRLASHKKVVDRVSSLAREASYDPYAVVAVGCCELGAQTDPGALVQDADQVDDGIGTAEQVGHCGAIVRIAVNDFNRRQQQQMTGSCTTPRDDEDAPRRSGKRGRQMAADEPAAAQHDNAGEAGHYSACVTTAAAPRGMIVPSRVDSGTYGRLSAFAYNIAFASTFFT